ncbi:peroxisomal biogenesis factor 3 [Teleopsis dalmanni]|uniref:peroxisomal biogenesis factor 3 n=1 Tax=Teleopsis dalmanni TaxID=139649 RepID=UPI0018CCE473|nr:peroxisomal biogenesis factor 3 [Teleopsis dalmanni]XP_037935259.1 peroxisomal biogenesis factor 3 [Teleopsis dalmanni]
MLSRLRDFGTRHRKKFIVTGILIGGTYFAIRYAQNKLLEFQERQAKEYFEKTRRLQHFEATERTCNQVILGMGTELLDTILKECSTTELLEQLRQNPSNKVELWEEMKIVSFTRLTTIIYATSMLSIALRVQLNLLGGYLYRDVTSENIQINDELKQTYLSLIGHFIHDGGLKELIRVIRSKIMAILKPLPLSKQLTLLDIEQLFWSIQMAVNSDSDDPNTKMSQYLLPRKISDFHMNGPLLEKLFNETLDVLETEDATNICSNNISRGFSLAVDAIAENLSETIQITNRETKKDINVDDDSSQNNNAVLNINNVHIALAKVIPIVSGITSRGFDNTKSPQNLPTSLLTFYVVAEKIKTLGANVYESFSSVPELKKV